MAIPVLIGILISFLLNVIMNKLVLFFGVLLGVCLCSCSSKKTASNTEELDTVWNEKVQNSFYDLKLGTPTSVEQIVNSLEKQGFYFVKEYLYLVRRLLYGNKNNYSRSQHIHCEDKRS